MRSVELLLSALALAASYQLPAGGACAGAVRRRAAAPPLLQEASAPEGVSTPATPAAASSAFSDMELAEQEAKLTALSRKWEKLEEEQDFQATKRSGFGPDPETLNGRFAMFFLIVGLITEYYTGQSMPDQVYTLLQTLAIVD